MLVAKRWLWCSVMLAALLTQGYAEAEREPVVIASPLANLAKINRYLNDVDVLGVDHKRNEVHLRLPARALHTLRTHAIEFTSRPELELIAEGSIEQYKDPTEVRELLAAYARDYPDLVELLDVGKTTDARPILGLVLSNKNKGVAKPSIVFNGMHHARELMSAEVILGMIDELLSGYGHNNEITAWLDQYQVVVVPQMNPDGNARVHNGDLWWRKNTWTQGGQVFGVDLNRNYPTLWNGCNGSSGSVFSQTYRGPSPASEPETQALMRLISRFKPVFNISYHAYSEIIIYPFGCRQQKNSASALFREVGDAMASEIVDDAGRQGTYQVGTAPELLYEADGSDLDYQWAEHGVMAYTIEINSQRLGFQPDYTTWRDTTVARQSGGWKTLLRRMKGPGLRAELRSTSPLRYVIEHQRPAADNLQASATSSAALAYEKWDADHPELRRSLRPHGLLYQPLAAGKYRLLVYRSEKLMASLPFTIGDQLVDLGKLDF